VDSSLQSEKPTERRLLDECIYIPGWQSPPAVGSGDAQRVPRAAPSDSAAQDANDEPDAAAPVPAPSRV